MPTESQLALFCVTAFLLILTPGPNFIYVLTRGTTQGRRAALLASVGLCCGVLLHTTLAVVGISALIRSSYVAFRVIKYGGSLYLIYLGMKAITARSEGAPSVSLSAATSRAIIWQSVVASMTNPKTILFFISFLPQFVNAGSPHVAPQMMALGGIYMLLTLLVYGMVATFAGSMGDWLRAQARAARHLRWMTGSVFIGLGLWAAAPDRR